MDITVTTTAKDRDEWRVWLQEHHATDQEIWLLIYKKSSGVPTVTYDEAVEEALCFGWIDGIAKSVDEKKRAQRFTPRRKGSNWSIPNKRRMKAMIEQGRMTEAGLKALGDVSLDGDFVQPAPEPIIIPPDLQAALDADPQALEFFSRLPKSYLRTSLRWINAAKRDETRQRRIQEFVEVTARGERIGMK